MFLIIWQIHCFNYNMALPISYNVSVADLIVNQKIPALGKKKIDS